MVCLRNICINTLHKGDNDDNNINNTLNTGYEEHTTKTKISQLLYMDDLKLSAKREEKIQKQI